MAFFVYFVATYVLQQLNGKEKLTMGVRAKLLKHYLCRF